MAPTVRGIGAFGSGTTSFTAAVPTAGNAPQAGDAMYIIMESSDSSTTAGTPNTPNGWTKLFENTITPGATNVSTLTIFGKIAGAGEANVTVDGVGDHCAGAMVVIANHGLATISATVVGAAADHGASTTNILAPSINVVADSLIITCMGLSDDANDTTNVSGVTNANLASITERIDNTVSTGAGGGVGIYTSTCAGTSTGTTEWDHDTAVASQSLQLGVMPKITLVVQSADSTPTSDNITLTQHNLLAIQAADSTHTSDNLALTQHNILTVQNADHGHTSDNLTLTASEGTGSLPEKTPVPIVFGPKFASSYFPFFGTTFASLFHHHRKSVKMTGACHGGRDSTPRQGRTLATAAAAP